MFFSHDGPNMPNFAMSIGFLFSSNSVSAKTATWNQSIKRPPKHFRIWNICLSSVFIFVSRIWFVRWNIRLRDSFRFSDVFTFNCRYKSWLHYIHHGSNQWILISIAFPTNPFLKYPIFYASPRCRIRWKLLQVSDFLRNLVLMFAVTTNGDTIMKVSITTFLLVE